MKRFIALFLALYSAFMMSGCEYFDYRKAIKAANAGELGEAAQLFSNLEDYRDSEEQLEFIGESYAYEGQKHFYCLNGENYDAEAAKESFSKAAELNCGLGHYYLGLLALRSSDENRFQTAMDCFETAISNGCSLGYLGKGDLIEFGRGRERDYETARTLYEEALKNGCLEANAEIGDMYRDAHGVERDCTIALDYYKKSLESEDLGYAQAAYVRLGDLFLEGIGGIPLDHSSAIEYYQKGIEAGSAESYAAMGNMLLHGYGIERNNIEAIELCETAISKGIGRGARLIADYYVQTDNADESTAAYEQAIHLGDIHSYVQYGYYLLDHDEYESANAMFQKAVDFGDSSGYCGLGYCSVVNKDYKAARKWYESGVELGDPDSLNDLGIIYRFGDGVSINKKLALSLTEHAIEAGCTSAYANMGYIWESGFTGNVDKDLALYYFTEGAKRGNSGCMYEIATKYKGTRYGETIPDDYSKNKLELYSMAMAADRNYFKMCQKQVDKLIQAGKIERETADQIIKEKSEHYILP